MNDDRPSYEPDLLTDEPVVPTAQPKLSAWSRLVKAVYEPSAVFEDIAIKPSWALVLVMFILLSVFTQVIAIQHLDMEATIMSRLEKRNVEFSEEQMNRAMQQGQKFAYIGPAVSIVIIPLGMAVLAGIFLVAIRLVGGETDFPRTFSAMLHAYWPASLVSTVIAIPLLMRLGKLPQSALQNIVKSNLGAFMAPDAPRWLRALGGSIDVFNIWIIVLMILAASTIGRISRGKAAVAVLLPWLIFLLLKVGGAALLGGM
jgi:hypothetical protein